MFATWQASIAVHPDWSWVGVRTRSIFGRNTQGSTTPAGRSGAQIEPVPQGLSAGTSPASPAREPGPGRFGVPARMHPQVRRRVRHRPVAPLKEVALDLGLDVRHVASLDCCSSELVL